MISISIFSSACTRFVLKMICCLPEESTESEYKKSTPTTNLIVITVRIWFVVDKNDERQNILLGFRTEITCCTYNLLLVRFMASKAPVYRPVQYPLTHLYMLNIVETRWLIIYWKHFLFRSNKRKRIYWWKTTSISVQPIFISYYVDDMQNAQRNRLHWNAFSCTVFLLNSYWELS